MNMSYLSLICELFKKRARGNLRIYIYKPTLRNVAVLTALLWEGQMLSHCAAC